MNKKHERFLAKKEHIALARFEQGIVDPDFESYDDSLEVAAQYAGIHEEPRVYAGPTMALD